MSRILISLCLAVQFLQLISAQAVLPVVVVTTHGKVKSKLESGKCIKPVAGTLLKKEGTIKLKKNSDALVYANNRFITFSNKGKYPLENLAEKSTRNAKLNFDPLFGEYIKSAVLITGQSQWNIKTNKSNGDGWNEISKMENGGWGPTNPKEKGGWGTTNPKEKGGWGTTGPKEKGGWGTTDPKEKGGWGTTNPKEKGGWGTTNPKEKGGWGTTDPKEKSGWGTTDPKEKGGWGTTNPKDKGGWGTSDPKDKGGWGTTDPKEKGGWGTTDPKEKGGWGTSDPKDKGGWGINDMNIEPACPGGIYKNGATVLRWLKAKDVEHYMICIFDEDVNLITNYVVQDTFVWLDLSKFNLDPQKTYYWQIIAYGQKLVSPPVTFVILPMEDQNEILETPKNSDIYSNTDTVVKGMMEAVALESNKMNMEALNTYDKTLSQYPENKLLRMLYAAFCVRMGQYAKAKMIMEK
ncbi:MAG: hypothetical protein IPN15_17330 [Saprospiraceae bacterium]|nr:hypothetical protein [Candidatus Vicinibacter affinis]